MKRATMAMQREDFHLCISGSRNNASGNNVFPSGGYGLAKMIHEHFGGDASHIDGIAVEKSVFERKHFQYIHIVKAYAVHILAQPQALFQAGLDKALGQRAVAEKHRFGKTAALSPTLGHFTPL